MQQLSYQSYSKHRKPFLNTYYPFLTQKQISAKLRKEWTSINSTKIAKVKETQHSRSCSKKSALTKQPLFHEQTLFSDEERYYMPLSLQSPPIPYFDQCHEDLDSNDECCSSPYRMNKYRIDELNRSFDNQTSSHLKVNSRQMLRSGTQCHYHHQFRDEKLFEGGNWEQLTTRKIKDYSGKVFKIDHPVPEIEFDRGNDSVENTRSILKKRSQKFLHLDNDTPQSKVTFTYLPHHQQNNTTGTSHSSPNLLVEEISRQDDENNKDKLKINPFQKTFTHQKNKLISLDDNSNNYDFNEFGDDSPFTFCTYSTFKKELDTAGSDYHCSEISTPVKSGRDAVIENASLGSSKTSRKARSGFQSGEGNPKYGSLLENSSPTTKDVRRSLLSPGYIASPHNEYLTSNNKAVKQNERRFSRRLKGLSVSQDCQFQTKTDYFGESSWESVKAIEKISIDCGQSPATRRIQPKFTNSQLRSFCSFGNYPDEHDISAVDDNASFYSDDENAALVVRLDQVREPKTPNKKVTPNTKAVMSKKQSASRKSTPTMGTRQSITMSKTKTQSTSQTVTPLAKTRKSPSMSKAKTQSTSQTVTPLAKTRILPSMSKAKTQSSSQTVTPTAKTRKSPSMSKAKTQSTSQTVTPLAKTRKSPSMSKAKTQSTSQTVTPTAKTRKSPSMSKTKTQCTSQTVTPTTTARKSPSMSTELLITRKDTIAFCISDFKHEDNSSYYSDDENAALNVRPDQKHELKNTSFEKINKQPLTTSKGRSAVQKIIPLTKIRQSQNVWKEQSISVTKRVTTVPNIKQTVVVDPLASRKLFEWKGEESMESFDAASRQSERKEQCQQRQIKHQECQIQNEKNHCSQFEWDEEESKESFGVGSQWPDRKGKHHESQIQNEENHCSQFEWDEEESKESFGVGSQWPDRKGKHHESQIQNEKNHCSQFEWDEEESKESFGVGSQWPDRKGKHQESQIQNEKNHCSQFEWDEEESKESFGVGSQWPDRKGKHQESQIQNEENQNQHHVSHQQVQKMKRKSFDVFPFGDGDHPRSVKEAKDESDDDDILSDRDEDNTFFTSKMACQTQDVLSGALRRIQSAQYTSDFEKFNTTEEMMSCDEDTEAGHQGVDMGEASELFPGNGNRLERTGGKGESFGMSTTNDTSDDEQEDKFTLTSLFDDVSYTCPSLDPLKAVRRKFESSTFKNDSNFGSLFNEDDIFI